MNNLPRWFMVAVLILAVLGLLWWARGPTTTMATT